MRVFPAATTAAGIGSRSAGSVSATSTGSHTRSSCSARRTSTTASESPRCTAVGELGDGAAETVNSSEHDDRLGDRTAGPRRPGIDVIVELDDVAEHGAGLDRHELLGVTDQHEPRRRSHRLPAVGPSATATPSRSRPRSRPRGADDWSGRGGTGHGCRASTRGGGAASTPMPPTAARARRHRRRAACASKCTASSRRAAALPVGAARATSGGGAPRATACSMEQRQDAGDGRGLSGSGPSGDDGEVPQHRGLRGAALEVVVGQRTAATDLRRALLRLSHRRPRRAGQQVRRHLPFLPPVAVEVEPGTDESKRQRLALVVVRARPAGSPTATRSSRPSPATAELRRSTGTSPSTTTVSRMLARSVADVARDGGAHRERRRQQHALVIRLHPSRPRRRATWTSAALSTPASLNTRNSPPAERTTRTSNRSSSTTSASAGSVTVTRPPSRCRRGRSRTSPGPAAAARRRCRTSAHRPVGVSGPTIPRTNRYSTPARLRSGE